MSGDVTNTYLVGVLDCDSSTANFESVAQAVNYLRGQDIKIMVGAAKIVDEHTRFPIIVENVSDLLLGGGKAAESKTAAMLKAVFDSYNVIVSKATPASSNLEQLKAISQVASMNPRAERVHARDLAPKAYEPDTADPFDGLVGLAKQKERLLEIGNAVAAYGRESLESLHLCFTGDPGVGKTELARRMHRFFEAKGILAGGPFVQASAQDLVAKYVGQTPDLVHRAFERAEGGILFVDEAYQLSEGEGNEFGVEAIHAIVQLLDERRDNVVCVFAGYPDLMKRMLSLNPGFRERIGFHVEFPAYSVEELAAIFHRFARAKGFQVDPDAQQAIHDACAKMASAKDFANARSVRRLHDRAVMKAASRTGKRLIGAEDVLRALKDEDMGIEKRIPIGFGA